MDAKKPKAAKARLHIEFQVIVTDSGWEVESLVSPQPSPADGWGLLCGHRAKLGNKAEEIWAQGDF